MRTPLRSRNPLVSLSCLGLLVLSFAPPALAETEGFAVLELFRRGDSDSSGGVDISDALATLGSLFLGDVKLGCEDAADTNDDGVLDTGDANLTLNDLFTGKTKLPLPGARQCGLDRTRDRLSCRFPQPCPVPPIMTSRPMAEEEENIRRTVEHFPHVPLENHPGSIFKN
jgi:hypothetical protein